ncbi:hypothetical protein GCM10020331_009650 [Ectobacillus funiculus]
MAILTFAMGIERIGSSKAAIFEYFFDPIVTVLLSSVLFHETLGQTQKLGIVVILISTLLTHVSRQKVRSTTKSEKSTFHDVTTRRNA